MYHAVVSIQLLNQIFHVIGTWRVFILETVYVHFTLGGGDVLFFKCRSVMHVCLDVFLFMLLVTLRSEVQDRNADEWAWVVSCGNLWISPPSAHLNLCLEKNHLPLLSLASVHHRLPGKKKSAFRKRFWNSMIFTTAGERAASVLTSMGGARNWQMPPLIFCWLEGWPFCCFCRWGGEYGGTGSDSSGGSSFSLNYTGDRWLTRLAPASWHFRPMSGSASWLGWGQFQPRGAQLESTEL